MTNCAHGQTHTPHQYFLVGGERFPLGEPGYVYIVQWGDEGPVKIGMAVEPRFRLAELQCANWNQIHLRAVVPVIARMADVEKRAHQLADEYRLRGEWFDLEPLEAVECVLAAAAKCGVEVWPFAETMARVEAEKCRALREQRCAEEEARREHLRVQCGWDV